MAKTSKEDRNKNPLYIEASERVASAFDSEIYGDPDKAISKAAEAIYTLYKDNSTKSERTRINGAALDTLERLGFAVSSSSRSDRQHFRYYINRVKPREKRVEKSNIIYIKASNTVKEEIESQGVKDGEISGYKAVDIASKAVYELYKGSGRAEKGVIINAALDTLEILGFAVSSSERKDRNYFAESVTITNNKNINDTQLVASMPSPQQQDSAVIEVPIHDLINGNWKIGDQNSNSSDDNKKPAATVARKRNHDEFSVNTSDASTVTEEWSKKQRQSNDARSFSQKHSDQGIEGRTVSFVQKSCYESDSSSFAEQVKKGSCNQKG